MLTWKLLSNRKGYFFAKFSNTFLSVSQRAEAFEFLPFSMCHVSLEIVNNKLRFTFLPLPVYAYNCKYKLLQISPFLYMSCELTIVNNKLSYKILPFSTCHVSLHVNNKLSFKFLPFLSWTKLFEWCVSRFSYFLLMLQKSQENPKIPS